MSSKEIEQIVLAPILSDPFYTECIRLAKYSKASEQRYGSLLVKNNAIVGRGYNRAIAHPSFGKLDRIVYQGYANHAEIEALNDAIMNGYDVSGAEVFVGGYFPKENNLLFLKNEYTCLKCPPILKRFNIKAINVPTPGGWLAKNIDESMIEANNYVKGKIYNNRINSVIGKWTLSDLTILQK